MQLSEEQLKSKLLFLLLATVLIVSVSGVINHAPTVKEACAMEDFKPVIESVNIMPQKARPGDIVEYTIKFRNDGSETAENEYKVFVHFEFPDKGCDKIKFQQDHEPLVPTVAWEPGKIITDGPYTVQIPSNAEEGTYYMHIGVYQWEPHVRFCDEYAGQITIDKKAETVKRQFTSLQSLQVEKRRKALSERLKDPQIIESESVKISVNSNGIWEILDKQSGVAWHSSPDQEGFGSAMLNVGGKKKFVMLDKLKISKEPDMMKLESAEGLAVIIKILQDGRTVEFSYDLSPPPQSSSIQGEEKGRGVEVESIRLLENSPWVTDSDKGYALVPSRMGMLIPADNGIVFSKRFNSFEYEGCDMEMMGMVKQGSALLISWHDPYVEPELKSRFEDSKIIPGSQIVSTSFTLKKSAKSIRLIFLGKGGAGTIGQAYIKEAKEKGWYSNWDEKINKNPGTAKLLGASNIKLWSCFARFMNAESTQERGRAMTWTFDEAAQVAEHIKNDLKIDKALFILGGWTTTGYDNQHPDILPVAPACGGNEALADCSKRVKGLGYLFCFHDNYQDMYADAPSFSEEYIMRDARGNLLRGGVWNGGLAYITCSKKALELAKRRQTNLPEVKKLFDPTAYFIDTTFAAGLIECHSPDHPLTKWDDMKYKQELGDYSRSLFGIFGSEDGKEWAVPHSEFFEGIGGVSGRYYHNQGLLASVGGIEIPLFSMVYHDCIAIYGKYGYDWSSAADYVLYHLSGGYTLHYHSLGAHLYWKSEKAGALPITPFIKEVVQKDINKFSIKYAWRVRGKIDRDLTAFVHFCDSAGAIKFQNDHNLTKPTSKWDSGTIEERPFTVKVPEGLKGTFQVMVGLFDPKTMVRELLEGDNDGERRFRIGYLKVEGDSIIFEPSVVIAAGPDKSVFCRSDNGWAEGMCTTDIFLKNTHEVLSPLHELTARMNITDYEFLTADYKVRRSVFGNNEVFVTVNAGDKDYEYKCRDGSKALLPPFGFIVESPQYIAFHALSYNGVKYDKSALFTIRSLDGSPVDQSTKIRVFHGFGGQQIKIWNKVWTVAKEEIIE